MMPTKIMESRNPADKAVSSAIVEGCFSLIVIKIIPPTKVISDAATIQIIIKISVIDLPSFR